MYALQCKHIGIQSTAAHSLPVVDCKAVVETSIRKDWGFCVSRGYNWGTLINQFQRRLRELTNSGTTHRECKSWEFAPQTSHHVGVGGATHNLSRIFMYIRIIPTKREQVEMAEIGERFITKKKTVQEKTVKINRRRNDFKKNVPKRLRKEWGERMNHLRSISG